MSLVGTNLRCLVDKQDILHRQKSIRMSKSKMKGEPLQKPPPLLLPSTNHARNIKNRLNTKCDHFNGITKRVSEMSLGMDTDETTTESESSSVRTRSSLSSGRRYNSSSEDHSSPFEDESSGSSVTGSDHCPPYEEIPTMPKRYSQVNISETATINNNNNRYSCSSFPSPPPSASSFFSFRDSLPPAPSPPPVYSNELVLVSRRSSSTSATSHYSNSEVTRRRPSRPISLYSNCDQTAPLYSNTPEPLTTDVNENETALRRLEVSDSDRKKIECFFRGLRTELWVSSCLANLYISGKGHEEWSLKFTGVPLILLDSGETKSRNKRRIQIILAEQGTGFPLWKDTIDHLADYRKSKEAFHTMHLSSDHQQKIGLSFDSESEAEKLFTRIETLTADPNNINISVPGAKKKKNKTKQKFAPLPNKKQISNPCLFEHVTSVGEKDKPVYTSLKTLLDARLLKKNENIA